MPQTPLGIVEGLRRPEKPGYGDPKGGVPSSPAALRDACDAMASRRIARLTGTLGKPSYGYHMLKSIH